MSEESGVQQARTDSWAERVKQVKKEVMTPADQRGMGLNAGMTREDVLARKYAARGSDGVIVLGGKRGSQSYHRALVQ